MKWNILVGSLVLGFGLSTQSFGMDLLDRMLGTNYNGCCDKATCCDTPCADPGPSCGCDTGCDVQCVPCKPKCRRTPLLDLLRGCQKCKKSSCDGGCDATCADPGCGAEIRLAVAKPLIRDVALSPLAVARRLRRWQGLRLQEVPSPPAVEPAPQLHGKKSCCGNGCDDVVLIRVVVAEIRLAVAKPADPGCGC